MEFWPDHTVRCTACGRSMGMALAREDGWKFNRPDPVVNRTNVPVTVQGLCWRCDRERRAKEMGCSL